MHFKFTMSLALLAAAAALPAATCVAQATAPPTVQPAGGTVWSLADFGPLATPEQADRTLAAATAAVQAKGGGMLIIPATAPAAWRPQNVGQEALRQPAAPAPATYWSIGAGVTLIDARKGKLFVPQFSGMTIARDFRLPEGDSSPHWQYHPMISVKNNFVRGTSDYLGELVEAVKAGKGQRCYVDTTAGVFPGQILAARPDAKSSQISITVSALGYDRQSRRPYFVADAAQPLPAGAVLERHDIMSMVAAQTNANNELQTFDITNIRHHYSQGDSYLYDAQLSYLGDAKSRQTKRFPANIDDESGFGSVVFNAKIKGETNIFRGVVSAANPARGEVTFDRATNAHTLSSGRPLINMNPRKWVTAGHAMITNPGGARLNWGGSLRSTDAPWSADLVGRFFALDEPSEYVPGTDVRRWYYITAFSQDEKGTKILNVQRFWWGAKNGGVGISQLYNGKNYTNDEKRPVLLKYVIAPGSNVYDASDGVGEVTREDASEASGAHRRLIRIAPHAQSGTNLDFQPGDAIEQAIGAEPFSPIPFRIWMWDTVPGVFPAPVFDVSNGGAPGRNVMQVAGPGLFGTVVSVEADTGIPIDVRGNVGKAVVLFHQKDDQPQQIAWNPRANSLLGVNPKSGGLTFTGSADLKGRGASLLKGLGYREGMQGANLRGIAVPVAAGATALNVIFPNLEINDQYALKVQPGWPTDHAVVSRTATGFQLQFSAAAPAGAKVDWLLVR